jgi:hypothetical protein
MSDNPEENDLPDTAIVAMWDEGVPTAINEVVIKQSAWVVPPSLTWSAGGARLRVIYRAMVVAAFLVALVAGSVRLARPAQAQDQGPGAYAPVVGLCIRKIVNLPLLDLPDQPIDLMLGGQVDCQARGG